MKKFAAFALILIAFVPALAARQAAASFTGKWEGTFTRQRADGTDNTQGIVFNLTQKGAVITGTTGPADQQWPVEKGAVKAGTATFDVQQPNGPLFKFTLTIVKGRLTGDMAATKDGQVGGHAKVDAAKAK
jgi:hypothetical protein